MSVVLAVQAAVSEAAPAALAVASVEAPVAQAVCQEAHTPAAWADINDKG